MVTRRDKEESGEDDRPNGYLRPLQVKKSPVDRALEEGLAGGSTGEESGTGVVADGTVVIVV